jgi:cytoskeleton protein RodZ
MSDIGHVLKQGRIALGLDIEDIAKRTCISGRYLRAMENDQFEVIPKVYDKGYLKVYANFLHVDTKMLLTLYEQQIKSNSAIQQH